MSDSYKEDMGPLGNIFLLLIALGVLSYGGPKIVDGVCRGMEANRLANGPKRLSYIVEGGSLWNEAETQSAKYSQGAKEFKHYNPFTWHHYREHLDGDPRTFLAAIAKLNPKIETGYAGPNVDDPPIVNKGSVWVPDDSGYLRQRAAEENIRHNIKTKAKQRK